MKRLDVNLINLFSSYHVWEESNRFYFETDYAARNKVRSLSKTKTKKLPLSLLTNTGSISLKSG